MKKCIASLFGLWACIANANTENSANNQPDLTPKVVLAVYDVSGSQPKMLKGLEISRSNPNHYLCWTASNVSPVELNLIIEQFTTPTSIRFVDENGIEAQRDKSGKMHLFTGRTTTLQNQLVEKCWRFSQKYPRGEYSIALRVNEVEFPAQKFKIVK